MAVEQLTKLMNLKLKKDEDPDMLGDEISNIETMYRSEMSEKEKVVAVVKAAGALYSDVIRQESKDIERAGVDVTVEASIDAMSEKFRISGGNKEPDDDKDSTDHEVTLTNKDVRKFSGVCYHCGEVGHRKNECPVL